MTTHSEHFPPRTALTEKLAEKEYRHAFVETEIRRGLPLQIRAIREAREMSQKNLGEAATIPQANISRIENTRDSFLSFATLLRIAAAFDVALVVKFAPFSELEEWANCPLSQLVPPDFSTEWSAREEKAEAEGASAKVTDLKEYAAQLLNAGQQREELGYGSHRDPKSSSPLSVALGVAKSPAKGRALYDHPEDGRALPLSKVSSHF
jgi:transcriptional regulator with XRE-family HTH domain